MLTVILAVNGIDLTERAMSFKEVLDLVRSTKPGAPLVLDIMRTVGTEKVSPLKPPGDRESTSPLEKSNESTNSEVKAPAASSSMEVPSEVAPPKGAPSEPSREIPSTEALAEEAAQEGTHPKDMPPADISPKGPPEQAPSDKAPPKEVLPAEASSKEVQSRTTPPTNAQDNDKLVQEAESQTLASQQKSAAPGSKKRGRKRKDPNSPKEPRSAYIFFLIEVRPKIAAEFPGKSPQEISSIVGSRWTEMSPGQKKKYQDLHEQDRERYRDELAKYVREQAIEATEPAEDQGESQTTAISPPEENVATSSPPKRPTVAEASEKKARKLTPTGRPACVAEGCTKQSQGKKNNYMCNKHFAASGGVAAGSVANLEVAAPSPVPVSSTLNTPGSKRKAPSQSTSQSKLSTSAKRPKSAGRKLCSVDQCTKGSQNGTGGLCVSHWNEQVKSDAQADGARYKGMRVAKTFDADVYFGSVKMYFEADKEDPKSEALWNVVYDDGDEEDLNVRELANALRLYNQKKRNDPKAANGGNGELPQPAVDLPVPVDLEKRSEG